MTCEIGQWLERASNCKRIIQSCKYEQNDRRIPSQKPSTRIRPRGLGFFHLTRHLANCRSCIKTIQLFFLFFFFFTTSNKSMQIIDYAVHTQNKFTNLDQAFWGLSKIYIPIFRQSTVSVRASSPRTIQPHLAPTYQIRTSKHSEDYVSPSSANLPYLYELYTKRGMSRTSAFRIRALTIRRIIIELLTMQKFVRHVTNFCI